MARMTLFNSPLLLGFDEIERVLDRVARKLRDGELDAKAENAESANSAEPGGQG